MGRLLIQFAGTNTTKALSETLPKNTIIVDEDLHQLRLHDGTTAGGHIIGGSGGGGVPVGTIIPFAGNSIPEGYLLCDGSAISRTDYATLFAVIGTIYGTGDGNSTFNLPNLTGRIPLYDSSSAIGTISNGKLPNIRATFGVNGSWSTNSGCVTKSSSGSEGHGWNGSSTTRNLFDFNASRSSTLYTNGQTSVVSANVNCFWCIKYKKNV